MKGYIQSFFHFFQKPWIALGVLALGGIIGWYGNSFIVGDSVYQQGKIIRAGASGLVNPLLMCEINEGYEFKQFVPLKQTIEEIIAKEKIAGRVSNMSIYFRALNNGRWTGINENDKFSPASLTKVVLMIAYLREAEDNPSLLEQKIAYADDIELNAAEQIKPSQVIVKGQTYTIDDLINRMIIYSDNNAAYLLAKNISDNAISDIFTDLGLAKPDLNHWDSMSVKEYSLFFRILYNATYLGKAMSEKALTILAKSDFADGLAKNIPPSLAVAHKFGERLINDASTNNQAIQELHDCGIIYYPSHPYFLCIMTKGKDISSLEQIISEISDAIYSQIDLFFKTNKIP